MLRLDDAPVKKTEKRKVKRKRTPRAFDYEKAILTMSRLKPRYLNLGLFLPVLAVSIFGVLMVYSASWYNAEVYQGNRYYFFTSQLIGLIVGILALTLTYHLDFKTYHKRSKIILGIAVVLLLLVFVPGLGIERLGAQRWIGVGGFTIQPSELAKFAFIIFAASIAATSTNKNNPTEQLTVKKFFIILASGGLLCGLILLQPNLSIVMTLGATMIVCLFLFGARWKHLLILAVPILIIIPVMLIAEPYRIARLVAFVDPWATPRAEGFQLIQSLFSLGNGGLFGRGFLNSTQKYMFLPFSESDFIFSIIGEEFGLVGAVIFLATLGFIVFKIFKVGLQSKDIFGRYVCFGIAALIFIQSAINIAVVTGSIPPTGLPLPFVSFGGTSLAVFLAGIGIVLNIDKYNKKLLK
ncbi:MAG: putative lipid II flippase FtsW [Firmicutes bacterium]|nr:putative lipid II flippase FtsW [Bacillota bacterium]